MALPLDDEDVEKLKGFIDYLAANPTILNLPQLEFLKKFIEKLGGKVPQDVCTIPAKEKRPFDGGASGSFKLGSKCTINEEEEEDDSCEEDETLSHSESEVELDMDVGTFAANYESNHDNESAQNAVYLMETDSHPKIKAKRQIKRESMSADEDVNVNVYECDKQEAEDPINTISPMVVIKTEEEDEPVNVNASSSSDDEDWHYQVECSDDEPKNIDKKKLTKKKTIKRKRCTRRTRSSKRTDKEFWESQYKSSKRKYPKPINCPENCKQKCRTKIDKKLRQQMCMEFWSLNYVDRKNFLLTCVETIAKKSKIRTVKSDRVTRQYTKHYFLKNREGEKTRVCLSFFLSTLSISGYLVTNALENRDSEGNYIARDNRGGHRTKKVAEPTVKPETTAKQADTQAMEVVENNEVIDHPANEPVNDSKLKPGTCQGSQPEIQPQLQTKLDSDETIKQTDIDLKQQIKLKQISCSESSQTKLENNEAFKQTDIDLKPQPKLKQKSSSESSKQKTTLKNQCRRSRKLAREHVPRAVNCDESCTMKCTTHFTEEQRVQICTTFWKMDFKRRMDFVLSRIDSRELIRMTTLEYRKTDRAMRAFNNRYYLRGLRGENIRVCANFFMATLHIGRHVINNALKNVDRQTGFYTGEDKRGRRPPNNKTPDYMLDEVRRHIESYPTWVPHKGSKTRYLHSSLSLCRMHREYKQVCDDQQRKSVSSSIYSSVFHKEYRLEFLKIIVKHPYKSSKSDTHPDGKPKRINTNISEYTGKEGGFWIQPETGAKTDDKQCMPCPQVITNTSVMLPTANTNVVPTTNISVIPTTNANESQRVQIQENVQIHGPQSAVQSSAAPYFSTVAYVETRVPIPPQAASQNLVAGYANTAYEQHSQFYECYN